MTSREHYFFSKAKHKYFSKKRKRKDINLPPNLRRRTETETTADTIGYTGTTRTG